MDGILIINKPKGYTSHDIVNVLRKKLNTRKIGHTGTLDPNATGVLPILIGQATKVSKYLIEHNKEYIAELKLGEQTTTGDLEGKIINKKEVKDINKERIEEVLKKFIGEQLQTPPIYSAIKVNGKKAYEYARSNEAVVLEPRKVNISNIKLLDYKDNVITYKVNCSKGTYIRVLCEEIAQNLGTLGTMQNLVRTKVDKFKIEDAIELEKVEKNIKLLSIEEVFCDKEKIVIDNSKVTFFLNGVKLTYNMSDGVYRIYEENLNFLGLGIIENKLLKRDVII